MKRLDRQRSLQLAEKIHAKPLRTFENALDALDHLPDGANYVEGWVVNAKNAKLESRGWCEINGSILDPTGPESDNRYFPGVHYSKTTAKSLLNWHRRRVPLIWSDTDPFDHETYLDALACARRAFSRECGRSNGKG